MPCNNSIEKNNNNWVKGLVIGYDFVSYQSFYIIHDDSDAYMYAEPIETKRVLKDLIILLEIC